MAIASVFGLLLVLVVPPGGGYDEPVHFLRAWHVSDGHVFAQEGVRDGKRDLGAYVPRGLITEFVALLKAGVLDRHDSRGTWSHLGDPAPAGPRTFADFAAAAVYPPVPYVPAAVGIRVGRLFGASTFVLVLLARLADLAAFIAIVALAIRRLPSRAWVLAVLALTPVALFQAASVSADAITTALALLVLADALALMATPVGAVPRPLVIETVLATLALALSKEPYLLAAALLVLPLWRHRRALGAKLGGALAASGVIALAWTRWANDHYLPPNFLPASIGGHVNYANRDVQTSAQLRYVEHHPLAFPRAVGRMIADYGGSIAHDLVAQTSLWRVPTVIAVLIACGVGAVVALDARPVAGGRAMRALALGVAALMTIVSLFLAYIGWNALRAPRLDGFQGRYLLPMLGIVLLVVLPDRTIQIGAGKIDAGKIAAGPRELLLARITTGWSTLMLVLVEIGLVWHLYR